MTRAIAAFAGALIIGTACAVGETLFPSEFGQDDTLRAVNRWSPLWCSLRSGW